ncbi:MAG: NUDIX hydrolase [Candidatus Doudnabacteria bacterium]|nr:NUDIX hydrolase [Candidatus Doudnabacteria bacterium]
MNESWKKVAGRKVYENPFFAVFDDDVVKPDGSRGKYYVMRRKNGVVIVPFDGEKLFLINQYRYALLARTWELPAGASESDDLLSEAKKELLEETGYSAKSWTFIGKFDCAPGFTDHAGHVFLATGLHSGDHKREGGEVDMYMRGFTLAEIDKMISAGQITDSWTITSFYFFKQHLNRW